MDHVLFSALLPKAHKAQSFFTVCYYRTRLHAARLRAGMKNGVPLEQPTRVESKARRNTSARCYWLALFTNYTAA